MKELITNQEFRWDELLGRVALTYYENYGLDEAFNDGIISPNPEWSDIDYRHFCFFNDECFIEDNTAYFSYNLTDDALAWYPDKVPINKDAEDLSATFTEVWYQNIDGKYIEIIRSQTTYTDGVIRRWFLREPKAEQIAQDPEKIEHQSLNDQPS